MSMADEGHYYKRSMMLLRRDQGWIKPLLVLAAARFVPLVGPLGVSGYALEWARLTAWGVDASPKQHSVQVGTCIKAGWRGFLAALVPLVVVICLTLGMGALTESDTALSGIASLLNICIGAFGGILAIICALHATIYQKFTAGWRFGRIAGMLRENFQGYLRIVGLRLVVQLILGIIAAFISMSLLVGLLGEFFTRYGMWAYSDVLSQLRVSEVFDAMADLMRILRDQAPVLALFLLVTSVCDTFVDLISHTAVGLWMRQFSVPQWGRDTDPLPQK